MKIEELQIEKLKSYSKNARKHSEKQIDALCENIKRFGFVNPILVDNELEIISGHGRVMAARKLGIKKIPTIRVEDLTPKEVRALRIADNKLAEMSKWDKNLLQDELAELDPGLIMITNAELVEDMGDNTLKKISFTLPSVKRDKVLERIKQCHKLEETKKEAIVSSNPNKNAAGLLVMLRKAVEKI